MGRVSTRLIFEVTKYSLVGLLGLATAGCVMVGFPYEHDGQRYTMTHESISYYEDSSKEVQKRYGDPA